MSKEKFIKSLEGISEEFVSEEKANDLLDMANEVFEEFEDEIERLESDLKEKDSKIDDLKGEIEALVEELEESESISSFVIEGNHKNIRITSCLESIFKNLDYIPIDELETIVKKYAVL